MKSLFRLIFFPMIFTSVSQAAQVSIQYQGNHSQQAVIVSDILSGEYSIPKSIISISKVSKCSSQDKRFLEFCINKKGELNEFSNNNIKKIIKSLKVFSQGRTNEI